MSSPTDWRINVSGCNKSQFVLESSISLRVTDQYLGSVEADNAFSLEEILVDHVVQHLERLLVNFLGLLTYQFFKNKK